ncbi:metacaspase CasA, partial [Pseudohyphozyma bogoriensis]
CHSGSALDLPYIYSTEGKLKEPNLLADAGKGAMGAVKSYMQGDLSGVFSTLTSVGKKIATGNSNQAAVRQAKMSNADCISWSGCKDDQTSADASEAGKATGAMSFAFIAALTKYPQMSYMQMLNVIRDELRGRYSQKPQLSCSHELDCNLLFVATESGRSLPQSPQSDEERIARARDVRRRLAALQDRIDDRLDRLSRAREEDGDERSDSEDTVVDVRHSADGSTTVVVAPDVELHLRSSPVASPPSPPLNGESQPSRADNWLLPSVGDERAGSGDSTGRHSGLQPRAGAQSSERRLTEYIVPLPPIRASNSSITDDSPLRYPRANAPPSPLSPGTSTAPDSERSRAESLEGPRSASLDDLTSRPEDSSSSLAAFRERISASSRTLLSSETRAILQSARQALISAASFVGRLEEASRSLDNVSPPESPTRADDSSPPTNTSFSISPSTELVSPTTATLRRSVQQLLAASVRLNQLLEMPIREPDDADPLPPVVPPIEESTTYSRSPEHASRVREALDNRLRETRERARRRQQLLAGAENDYASLGSSSGSTPRNSFRTPLAALGGISPYRPFLSGATRSGLASTSTSNAPDSLLAVPPPPASTTLPGLPGFGGRVLTRHGAIRDARASVRGPFSAPTSTATQTTSQPEEEEHEAAMPGETRRRRRGWVKLDRDGVLEESEDEDVFTRAGYRKGKERIGR